MLTFSVPLEALGSMRFVNQMCIRQWSSLPESLCVAWRYPVTAKFKRAI